MNSERKQAQHPEEIINSCMDALLHENTTRILFEAAPIGIIVSDAHGNIVLINESAQRLFGYGCTELVGQPLITLIPDEMRAVHTSHCANYMQNPRIRPMGIGLNLNARHKDGHVFPVEVSLGFAETQLGLLAMAFVMDTSRQREAEQLRDVMIHTMVHDLRNPLGAIYTALELLTADSQASLDDNQKVIIGIASNNAQKMLVLIKDILDISELESGQIPLHLTTFQLNDLVAETITSLESLAVKKTLQLHNEVSGSLPAVQADAELIRRVLQNLIGNAIKFTPEEGLIRVTATREEGNTPKIRVSVSNTGPGIPVELQNRLFHKFIAGRHKERGHGLGLAFCKLAIEAHGEHIDVRSTPGEGATFSFTLPVAEP
ncbi:MAG TPA: PAS domain-containing sensor histidine kinase [Anaerolineae bacterium]|nr:PAS domain-containing sensor histidine kinase [Anaerolineae bacterium]HQI86789.1 PAS domain-containing sensor histidine kinase [Anaerolineae bacterium]